MGIRGHEERKHRGAMAKIWHPPGAFRGQWQPSAPRMQSNSRRMAGCVVTVCAQGGKEPIWKFRRKDDDVDLDGDDDHDDPKQRKSTATTSVWDLLPPPPHFRL